SVGVLLAFRAGQWTKDEALKGMEVRVFSNSADACARPTPPPVWPVVGVRRLRADGRPRQGPPGAGRLDQLVRRRHRQRSEQARTQYFLRTQAPVRPRPRIAACERRRPAPRSTRRVGVRV